MPELLDAYRTGAGVDWADYGPDVVEAQEGINRPQFHHLVGEWIDALPDIAARLRSGHGRVADVACGTGWSSISIARHFPDIEVDGIDIDEGSIARAKAHAAEAGVDGRVSFLFADAADAEGAGRYDLVTIFEAVHDMARPAEVLATARRLLAPGGAVLIADERVAETFTAPGDETERLFYAYSVMSCLANGLVDQPSVGTGTVLRPPPSRRSPGRPASARSRSCRPSTRLSASTASIRRLPSAHPGRPGRFATTETGVDSGQPGAILARTDRPAREPRRPETRVLASTPRGQSRAAARR